MSTPDTPPGPVGQAPRSAGPPRTSTGDDLIHPRPPLRAPCVSDNLLRVIVRDDCRADWVLAARRGGEGRAVVDGARRGNGPDRCLRT
jgi:hypothetical protein